MGCDWNRLLHLFIKNGKNGTKNLDFGEKMKFFGQFTKNAFLFFCSKSKNNPTSHINITKIEQK